MPKMDKNAAEVAVVFFDSMIQLAYVRLIQETQDLFLKLSAPFAGNDFDEIDLFVDCLFYDPVQFGVDLPTAVVDVM